MALVAKVVSSPGQKPQRRCPVCNDTALKERKTAAPRWRCGHGHTFDEPIEQIVPVTIYKAEYGNSFVSVAGGIPVSLLKAAALRPSDQLSIEQVDPHQMEAPLLQHVPQAREIFARFVQQWRPDAKDSDDGLPPGEKGTAPFKPSQTDQREVVLRTIRARRGQSGFRKSLIRRYGARCMISDCSVLDIVEAAHIWPYRGKEDNHPENGLLLRADLHTLFDLDLLGVKPDTLAVAVHPKVAPEGYSALQGKTLGTGAKHKPSQGPLERRWAMFLARLDLG